MTLTLKKLLIIKKNEHETTLNNQNVNQTQDKIVSVV